jgi:glycerol-3-phosphate dehydrogenase
VADVLNAKLGLNTNKNVRLVKGSHIVVPKLFDHDRCYIFQNTDGRIVFAIPYEQDFTLIGTTDQDYQGELGDIRISAEETSYLCSLANGYFARQITPRDVVWSYSGVRPLYDDGTQDPSAVTRDYTLRLDDAEGAAPVLSVFGGKLTTYRRLAENAVNKLAPYFPGMKAAWTSEIKLPGSDFTDREAAKREFFEQYRTVPVSVLQGIFRRHGTLSARVLGDGRLGEDYGAGLTEREVRYLIEREWAASAEDVLWRRTKCGLHMSEAQRSRVAQVVGR